MFIVRYETLTGSIKEFRFEDESMSDAFIEGLEKIKDAALIVKIEKLNKTFL